MCAYQLAAFNLFEALLACGTSKVVLSVLICSCCGLCCWPALLCRADPPLHTRSGGKRR
jgi:hypothetical protein